MGGLGVGHCIHGNQDGVMSRGSQQDDLQTENTSSYSTLPDVMGI